MEYYVGLDYYKKKDTGFVQPAISCFVKQSEGDLVHTETVFHFIIIFTTTITHWRYRYSKTFNITSVYWIVSITLWSLSGVSLFNSGLFLIWNVGTGGVGKLEIDNVCRVYILIILRFFWKIDESNHSQLPNIIILLSTCGSLSHHFRVHRVDIWLYWGFSGVRGEVFLWKSFWHWGSYGPKQGNLLFKKKTHYYLILLFLIIIFWFTFSSYQGPHT